MTTDTSTITADALVERLNEQEIMLDMWEKVLPLRTIFEAGKHMFEVPAAGFTLTAIASVSAASNPVFENYQCLVLSELNSDLNPKMLAGTVGHNKTQRGPVTIPPQTPIVLFLSDPEKPAVVLRGVIENLQTGPRLAWFDHGKSRWGRFDVATSQWVPV